MPLTPTAHSDLNRLLEALLGMSEMLLREHGEFYPIGAVIGYDGDVQHVGAKIDGDDHPPSQALIDLLTNTFRTEAAEGKLIAAGICFDGLKVPPGKEQKQDVICCGLEHCLGEAITVFRPYTKTETGDLEFQSTFSTERTVKFFRELPRI